MAVAAVNAAMQIRRKLDTIPPLVPGQMLCCARRRRESRQFHPVRRIGHSPNDSMVAQLRIFLSKALTKIGIKVNGAHGPANTREPHSLRADVRRAPDRPRAILARDDRLASAIV